MNRQTGKNISLSAHIMQSLGDILTTPVGSRVMRRDYGNRGIELIDAPVNGATIMQLVSRSISAIVKHEPRIEIIKIAPLLMENGVLLLIVAKIKQNNQIFTGVINPK